MAENIKTVELQVIIKFIRNQMHMKLPNTTEQITEKKD